MVRGGIGHHVPSEATGALVAFADEQRHPHPHVLPDHPEVVCSLPYLKYAAQPFRNKLRS